VSEPALIHIAGVDKQYGAPDPLRLKSLRVAARDRVVISGLDAPAAETLINLITGALVPDHGTVHVAGQDTRAIATDTDWLTSLDRFGIVTDRAILLGAMTVAANLALPLTLSIDPMPDEVRRQVEEFAVDVGLALGRLDALASTLSAAETMRVHVARALALEPKVLLIEHPTTRLDDGESEALGRMIRALVAKRGLALVVFSNHEAFARATGAVRLVWNPATGDLKEPYAARIFRIARLVRGRA